MNTTPVDQQFQMQKDKIRKHLLKYSKKAYLMLPWMDKPRILDIGCGSGIPTLELARLSEGEITAIDTDQLALDKLTRKIKDSGLSSRVQPINCSMLIMKFTEGSFDIIWAEGSIYVIGFERGLLEWKRFLKPGGFLVVHDEQGSLNDKLAKIKECGYRLSAYFLLSEETWRTEYFAPLEKLVVESRASYIDNPEILKEIDLAQSEIDMFNNNPEHNNSVFFVMNKSF